MTYREDPSTGKAIIELSDAERMAFVNNVIDRVAARLSQLIVEGQGEALAKEAFAKKEVIIQALQTDIVKKIMYDIEKKLQEK